MTIHNKNVKIIKQTLLFLYKIIECIIYRSKSINESNGQIISNHKHFINNSHKSMKFKHKINEIEQKIEAGK